MSDWKTLSSKIVYETPWIKVHRNEVLNRLSKPLTYSFVERTSPSVFIVVLNDKEQILFQKNYRYTIDKTIWELPAGHSDGDEPLVAAQRELLEEAGLISDDWTIKGEFYEGIGVSSMPLFVCVARNVQPTGNGPSEEMEQIEEHRFFSLDELASIIKQGESLNATDLGVLHIARLSGLLGQKPAALRDAKASYVTVIKN